MVIFNYDNAELRKKVFLKSIKDDIEIPCSRGVVYQKEAL